MKHELEILNLTRKSNQSSVEGQYINFSIFKGMRNVILSSKDADFIINSPVGRLMYNFFQLGVVTEEHFYATMIRLHVESNTNIVSQNISAKVLAKDPLTYTDGNTLNGVCPRYALWGCKGCFGKCVNAVCNLHTLDLDKMSEDFTKPGCLIANKFNLDLDPFAVTFQLKEILRKVSVESEQWKEKDWNSYFTKIKDIML